MDTTTSLISYFPKKHLIEIKIAICCRRNFEKISFDWKFKGLVPFLIVEIVWRATDPPPKPTISLNTSNQNFEITILFNAFDRSRNYVFKDYPPPPHTNNFKRTHSIGNSKN